MNGPALRATSIALLAAVVLVTSANDGIGVPSMPVMKMRYRSWFVAPHLNRLPVAKLYGGMGWSLLSVSVGADGPSPWPAGP